MNNSPCKTNRETHASGTFGSPAGHFPRTLRMTIIVGSIVFPFYFVLLLFSGCAVGPNYKRPTVNSPVDYRDAERAAQQASIADLPWWEVFSDDRLKSLVQTALANNYDLRIAITRIEQSRQIAAQARAQYFPFLNYSAGASAGKNEFAGAVTPSGGEQRGVVRSDHAGARANQFRHAAIHR